MSGSSEKRSFQWLGDPTVAETSRRGVQLTGLPPTSVTSGLFARLLSAVNVSSYKVIHLLWWVFGIAA